MKSRALKAILCMMTAALVSLVLALPAYADNGASEAIEEFMQENHEINQLCSDFMETSEYRELKASADEIADRIDALPENVSMLDRFEVEDIRREYNQFEQRVHSCSLYLQIEEYGRPDNKTMEYAFRNLFIRESALKDAEKQLGINATSNTQNTGAASAIPNSAPTNLFNAFHIPIYLAIAILVALAIWSVLIIVQGFMAIGTAYRKTKARGDSGVSLFGWMIAYNLAAIVPGLGIYLWRKSKTKAEIESNRA